MRSLGGAVGGGFDFVDALDDGDDLVIDVVFDVVFDFLCTCGDIFGNNDGFHA